MAYRNYRDEGWEEHLWEHRGDSEYLDDPEQDVDSILRERAQAVAERQECYSAFLESDYWQRVRNAVLKRARLCCEGCGRLSDHLEVHHKRYPRRGTELENLHMLEALCHTCHEAFHS